MAVHDSSRRTRRSGRLGGNRPQTPPKQSPYRFSEPLSPEPVDGRPQILPVLAQIQARLTLVLSAITVASSALKYQNAEIDADVALLLRRSVANEIQQSLVDLERFLANRSTSMPASGLKRGDVQ